MTFSYSGIKAKAEGLITKYGQPAILRRFVVDWEGNQTGSTDYACTALEIVKRDQPDANQPAPAPEATFYVLSTVEPIMGDVIVSDHNYAIVDIKALAPAAGASVWECRGRRAR